MPTEHTFSWAMLPSVTTLQCSDAPTSDWCCWNFRSFGMWRRVVGWVVPNVSKSPPSKRRQPFTRRYSVTSQKPWNFEHYGFRNDRLHPPLHLAVVTSQVRSKFIRNVNHYSTRSTVSKAGSWPSSTIDTKDSANSNIAVLTFINSNFSLSSLKQKDKQRLIKPHHGQQTAINILLYAICNSRNISKDLLLFSEGTGDRGDGGF